MHKLFLIGGVKDRLITINLFLLFQNTCHPTKVASAIQLFKRKIQTKKGNHPFSECGKVFKARTNAHRRLLKLMITSVSFPDIKI